MRINTKTMNKLEVSSNWTNWQQSEENNSKSIKRFFEWADRMSEQKC